LTEIRNREFYEKSKLFVVAALNLLVTRIQEGEKIPIVINEKIKTGKDGSWRTVEEQMPLFVALLSRHKKEFENLSECSDCVKAMTSDPSISKYLNVPILYYSIQFGRTAEGFLEYLLERQLPSNIEKIDFNSTLFDDAYQTLERFFYEDYIFLRVMSPLHNFTVEDERIDLDDNLCLRKIGTDEQEQIMNESRMSSMIPFQEAMSFKYTIELRFRVEKIMGSTIEAAKDPFEVVNRSIGKTISGLVTALRLFKTGVVGYNIVRIFGSPELPVPFGTQTSLTSPYKRFRGEQYTLTKLEGSKFKKFWESLDKIDFDALPQLSIALSRFNFAYERDKLEDKLIDFMVAFEALFFKEGEFGEFRHKLAVRVSRLLEPEYKKRKAIVEKMNEFYDERSMVVHGEKVDLKSDFINSVEDHLRKSIVIFLERLRTSDHGEIISRLDLE